MSLYFYGKYAHMLRVKDEVLIAQMGYIPSAINSDNPAQILRSSTNSVQMEFHGFCPVKVSICGRGMYRIRDGLLTERARTELERIVQLMQPTKILDFDSNDVIVT